MFQGNNKRPRGGTVVARFGGANEMETRTLLPERRSGFRLLTILLIAVSLWATHACSQESTAETEARTRILSAGDRVYLTVPSESELTGEFTIAENGKLYLKPLPDIDIGSFDVANKTVAEAEKMIADRLERFYLKGEVKLEVISSSVQSGPSVTVFGQTTDIGPQRYFEGMRLLDLLVRVKGLTKEADPRKVMLVRNGETSKHDISGLIQGTDLGENFALKPGDYVIVPNMESLIKIRVHVFGKVKDQGTYYLPEPAYAAAALAAAKGMEGRASARKIVVARMENDKPLLIPVSFSDIVGKGTLSENVLLKEDDIVFVPESNRPDIMQSVNNLVIVAYLRSITKNGF